MGLQIAGLATGVMSARQQAKLTQQGYDYQAQVNKNNAQIAEWQAQDALARGAKAEQNQRLKTSQLAGAQRARLAASGVALDEGSALSILQDTEFMGEMDAANIRDSAQRDAWGYRTQGANYRSDASFLSSRAGSISPNSAAFDTLLTGAGTVADSWYRRSRTGV